MPARSRSCCATIAAARTLGRVPILVERSNQAPVVETTSVLTLPAIPLNITPPVDPDGDALTITVAEVPERGAIKDGDRAVAVGEELSPQALAGLVLEPGVDGAFGSFAFKVTDNRGASVISAMRINVPAMAATAMPATAPQAAPGPRRRSRPRPPRRRRKPSRRRTARQRPRSRPRW